MARANFVKKARKPIPEAGIKVGDSYWWWKFRHGGKRVSKTKPRSSQLTQSDFLSRVYSILEYIEDMTTDSDFESSKEEILTWVEELRDEQEEKLNNMPDQLQYAPTGELLQERYDSLDSAYTEIDIIETEINEEEFEPDEDWDDFYDPDSDISEEDQKEQYEEEVREARETWLEERKQEILDEFQNIVIA